MTEPGSERLWKARGGSGRSKRLHARRDCYHLEKAVNDPRHVRRADYAHLALCVHCATDETEQLTGPQGPSLPAKLDKMNPEEVGL